MRMRDIIRGHWLTTWYVFGVFFGLLVPLVSATAHLLSTGTLGNPLAHGELLPAAFALTTSAATESSVKLVDTQSPEGRVAQLSVLMASLLVLVPSILLIGIVAATTTLDSSSVVRVSAIVYGFAVLAGFSSRYVQARS